MRRLHRLSTTREKAGAVPLGRMILFLSMVGLFFPGVEPWAHGENYIQSFESGRADWTNGIVEAFADGTPPAYANSPAQGRALAETEAKSLARNHLIGLLQSLRVDSKSTVKETLASKGAADDLVAAVLRNSFTAENSLLPDGAVRVTTAMKMNGAFADLVLPKTIVAIKSVEQSEKKEEKFTGLVIDCRGIPMSPAMVPVIVDEDGQVVYGTAYISRRYALEEGVAAYAKGMARSRENPRVGPNPLILKGLRTVKARASDIVISNADAGKIRGAGSNISFLHRGRVLFVME